MSPQPQSAPPVLYAAFRLRFHALIMDGLIGTGFFIVAALATAILFEDSPIARILGFVVIIVAIIAYEPVMVSRYGGTIGHRKSNIRIICSESDENLPIARAFMRSLVKQVFGLPCFIAMFMTRKSQGLHDLAAGARVIIRDPRVASIGDVAKPVLYLGAD